MSKSPRRKRIRDRRYDRKKIAKKIGVIWYAMSIRELMMAYWRWEMNAWEKMPDFHAAFEGPAMSASQIFEAIGNAETLYFRK